MSVTFAATADQIGELLKEPSLTVACVLLVVVSTGWVVITRLIVRRLNRAARRGQRVGIAVARKTQSSRDIWTYPP